MTLLSSRIEAARKAQADTLKEMTSLVRTAADRHDEAALAVKNLEPRARHNPQDERLQEQFRGMDEARAGLASALSYGRALVEIGTGRTPPLDPPHDARDDAGRFTQKHGFDHLYRIARGKK